MAQRAAYPSVNTSSATSGSVAMKRCRRGLFGPDPPGGRVGVLSIGKLRKPDYYLGQVASGLEDYYLGGGESPGRWRGAGAAAMGLAGGVDAGVFRQVLAGVHPDGGVRLVRAGTARRPRLPGLDLTFSAPKSVSVLYGLADREVTGQVVEAHEAAVAAALGYLEGHACFTRRRVEGVVEQVAGEGLVVAGFRHRTSRAGDPSLHTHCLVANLVNAVDGGGWGALDSRAIFRHSRTAGFVYQAVLRGELSSRLGVEWRPVHNGYADIDGIDTTVLRGFSRRRVEIEAALEQRGLSSSDAARAATLDTRQAKEYGVDPVTLRQRWADRATELGFSRTDLDTLLGVTPAPPMNDEGSDGLLDELATPAGLTERRSSFDRQDVLRALCSDLPAGTPATTGYLEALVSRFLHGDGVVPIVHAGHVEGAVARSDGQPVPAMDDQRRWSPAEMLAIEKQVIDNALERRNDGTAVAAPAAIRAAVAARPALNNEQAAMVAAVCGSGNGVEVVVGAAGTGKTFALDAARDAWQRGGQRVIGCALAARAARELETGSGIESTTIARLVLELEHPDVAPLPANTVVVVDEAAMVDTRTLRRILGHADAAHAKVLLVGDHHQLPEIDAGGAFASLATRLDPVELTENRRQTNPWERDALTELRVGDVGDALGTYRRHGRVTLADTAPDALAAMVEDWSAATEAGAEVLMIATRNIDVDDLNAAARRRLQDTGHITGPELDVEGRPFAAGDRVLFTRADRALGVINGDIATVATANPTTRTLTVQLHNSDRDPIEVDAERMERRRVVHAYATTVHKAQGATVDRLLVYGDDRLYREAGYVAMSRGRDHNQLYVVTAAEDHHDRHPDAVETVDPIEHLGNALNRSAAKTLATDQADTDRHHWGTSLEDLWQDYDRLDRWLNTNGPRATDPREADRITGTHAGLAAEAADLAGRREAAEERLAATPRWRRDDRRTAADARRYIQRLEQAESQVAARVDAAEYDLQTIATEKQSRLEWDEQCQPEIEARHDLASAIARRRRSAGRAAELDPPPKVIEEIGPPPKDLEARPAWRTAAGALISYRARWGQSLPTPDTAEIELRHRRRVALATTEVRRTRPTPKIAELRPPDGDPAPGTGPYDRHEAMRESEGGGSLTI